MKYKEWTLQVLHKEVPIEILMNILFINVILEYQANNFLVAFFFFRYETKRNQTLLCPEGCCIPFLFAGIIYCRGRWASRTICEPIMFIFICWPFDIVIFDGLFVVSPSAAEKEQPAVGEDEEVKTYTWVNLTMGRRQHVCFTHVQVVVWVPPNPMEWSSSLYSSSHRHLPGTRIPILQAPPTNDFFVIIRNFCFSCSSYVTRGTRFMLYESKYSSWFRE